MLETVIALVVSHWPSISAVALGVPALVLAFRQRAAMLFFQIALELVKKVAVQELAGEEKRKKVAEQAFDHLPIWAQKVINKKMLEDWVEVAYQQLKQEGQV